MYVKPVKSSSFLGLFKLEKNQQNSNVQSIHDPVVVMKFEFFGHSPRLLKNWIIFCFGYFQVEFYTLFFIEQCVSLNKVSLLYCSSLPQCKYKKEKASFITRFLFFDRTLQDGLSLPMMIGEKLLLRTKIV